MIQRSMQVRNVTFGDGIPKLCVPLTARSPRQAKEQMTGIADSFCDLIELRADYLEEPGTQGLEVLRLLRAEFPEKVLLFTFRTKEEGGEQSVSPEQYAAWNCAVAQEKAADLIDLELNRGEAFLQELTARIHETGTGVVASFHDFTGTPDETTLIGLLTRMQKLGADLTKAAVMPHSEQDVLTLLSASIAMKTKYADRPYITMAMGRLGGISRLAGTLTGSSVTFAAAGSVSAPGQMDAQLVRQVLEVLDMK